MQRKLEESYLGRNSSSWACQQIHERVHNGKKLHTTPTLDLFLNKNIPDFRHESVSELADSLTPLPNCRNSTVTCQRVLPEADRYDMTKEPKAKKEAETRSTGNAALFSSFLPVFSLVSPESSVVQPLSPKLSSGLATTAVKTQSPRGCRRAYLRRRSCGTGQPASQPRNGPLHRPAYLYSFGSANRVPNDWV